MKMIDWLIQILPLFSVVIMLLLVANKWCINKLGVSWTYYLWLLVPLSLVVPFIEIPNWYSAINDGQSMQTYMVTATQNSQWKSIGNVLLYAWSVGSMTLLIYWMTSHLTLKAKMKQWQKVTLPNDFSLPESLTVYQCAQVYSPMLIGLIKPVIVIPEHFFEIYDKEQQVLILEHEVCHFKRNDMQWNFIALALLALLWFHPLSWLAFNRFRRDQELSCDHAVLARKHKTCRINYSKALLVAAETSPPLAFAQLSFKEYGDKNIMFERIKQIKANTKTNKLAISTVFASAIAVLSAFSYAGDNHHHDKKMKSATVYPLTRVEPIYPQIAIDKKIEGSVVLKFDVTPAGAVENVSIVTAKPSTVFNEAAAVALSDWTYQTSSTGTKEALVQLDFVLGEDSPTEFSQIEQIKVTN